MFLFNVLANFAHLLLALIIGLLFGKSFIVWISKRFSQGQPIRDCGPLTHLISKCSTPNMGGFIIFVPLYIVWMFCCDSRTTWPFVLTLLGFGFLGFWDDYLKATRKNINGVTARQKLSAQFLMASAFSAMAYYCVPSMQSVFIPLLGYVDLGVWAPILGTFVIVATSNSVNLTDGLDGLASGPLLLNAFFLAVISPLLIIKPELILLSSINIMIAAFAGGCLAFLWYNAYPARIFMGDCGSLASGAFIGCISVLLGLEFLLVISGLIFVIEALSVIIQISYFRVTKGRRIFLMTPIHHHFEQLGVSEVTIVVRFWIFSLVCVMFAIWIYGVSLGKAHF